MRQLHLVVHNIRSTHNVGALLRTADCLGVRKVFFSGYSPYPKRETDTRLPHIQKRVNSQITKTSLGAEQTTDWSYVEDVMDTIEQHRTDGFTITSLEQTANSTPLPLYKPSQKELLVIGNEVHGVAESIIAISDNVVEIPQYGHKNSFNVVQASAIALYALREA